MELRNVSDTGLWVVGVLDGSEAGLRYPHYRTAILRDGRPTDQPGPEDPLVGPLLRSHFRRLAPGEAFAPGQAVEGGVSFPLTAFDHFSPSETGDYEYRLTFSTESARPEQWFGRFGQRAEERGLLLDLISRVPRCTMTASVTVTVR
ncbi:hypothetical protein ABZ471_27365 [Streptomyces sp. NPDC005728]|uniref:hypothetical protein n=1 Tax=Streptomyces sp. NPDC005728 TaxID=3157054 RepID=UPI0033C4DD8B